MNQESAILAETKITAPHCSARTPSGRRCRMAISDPASGLCFRHAAAQRKDRDAVNLAARLIGDTQEFTSAVAINRSLSELYKLLARDEIAPRRAAVMAYTCHLLLRTLPAIDRELHPASHEDRNDNLVVFDIPCAVAQRGLEAQQAQRLQDPERALRNDDRGRESGRTNAVADRDTFPGMAGQAESGVWGGNGKVTSYDSRPMGLQC